MQQHRAETGGAAKRADTNPRSPINVLCSELTERINEWWPLRLIYMPGVPHADGGEEHVEDIRQLLPLSYSPAQRRKYKLQALAATEKRFREAQAHEALGDLRIAIKRRAFSLKLKKGHKSGRGQKANTHMQSQLRALQADVDKHAEKYRNARKALRNLGMPNDDKTFLPLAPTDLWGTHMGDGWEDQSALDANTLGEGKRHVSWIWLTEKASMAASANSSWSEEGRCCFRLLGQRLTDYMSIADRVLWFCARARWDRWREEVEILEAEKIRSHKYFRFYAEAWRRLVGANPDTQLDRGRNAYCHKMQRVYEHLAGKHFLFFYFKTSNKSNCLNR